MDAADHQPPRPERGPPPVVRVQPVHHGSRVWYAVLDEAGVPLALARSHALARAMARILGCEPVSVH